MKSIMILLVLCIMLSGCSSWMSGHYASVEHYMDQGYEMEDGIPSVANRGEIRTELTNIVESATESRKILLTNIEPAAAEEMVRNEIEYLLNNNAIAAYAVETIHYEIGVTGGVPALMVTVEYNHNRSEIHRIRQVEEMSTVNDLITAALDEVESGIVLKVSNFRSTDFAQLVEDYAFSQPDRVMEIPQVTVNLYPSWGLVRIIELKFTYQNSRELLKSMKWYVEPRFASAALYVSGEEEQSTKFAMLYAFLMETTSYTQETSITPSYSLLRHSVGDSKAFATVYGAMCRRAGLDCRLVTGTKAGEPWFWNMICEDGNYYHVDLLRSSAEGYYRKYTDADMEGYVWDYDAYPASIAPIEESTDGTE